MEKMLRVIYKAPGEAPVEKMVKNEPHALQQTICGYIEVVDYRDGIIILCDEEGYLYGLRENVLGIYGPIVLCRVEGEDFASLRDDEVPKLIKELSEA